MFVSRALFAVVVLAASGLFACAVASEEPSQDPTESTQEELANGGAGFEPNCFLDRGGLHVPGRKNKKGYCCSVFDTSDCSKGGVASQGVLSEVAR